MSEIQATNVFYSICSVYPLFLELRGHRRRVINWPHLDIVNPRDRAAGARERWGKPLVKEQTEHTNAGALHALQEGSL